MTALLQAKKTCAQPADLAQHSAVHSRRRKVPVAQHCGSQLCACKPVLTSQNSVLACMVSSKCPYLLPLQLWPEQLQKHLHCWLRLLPLQPHQLRFVGSHTQPLLVLQPRLCHQLIRLMPQQKQSRCLLLPNP